MSRARVHRAMIAIRLLALGYPEYGAILLCVSAWIAMLVLRAASGTHDALCHAVAPAPLLPLMGGLVLHWLMMLSAMMLPLQMGSLRRVAERSLWNRRHRNIGLVLIGYCLPWLIAGGATELILSLLFPTSRSVLLPAPAFLLAAAWQLTQAKRRTLIRCHPEPLLAPTGRKGDWHCLRFGMLLAGRCGMSCWALMLACTVSQHALWAMALTSFVVWTERVRPQMKLVWPAAVLALAALATGIQ